MSFGRNPGGILDHKRASRSDLQFRARFARGRQQSAVGVFATLEAPDDYVRECFAQYGLTESADGKYAATYKPSFTLIGLELGISVANAALRGRSTGSPDDWRGDVVARSETPP